MVARCLSCSVCAACRFSGPLTRIRALAVFPRGWRIGIRPRRHRHRIVGSRMGWMLGHWTLESVIAIHGIAAKPVSKPFFAIRPMDGSMIPPGEGPGPWRPLLQAISGNSTNESRRSLHGGLQGLDRSGCFGWHAACEGKLRRLLMSACYGALREPSQAVSEVDPCKNA
jgi:hypothetical protein